MGEDYKAVQKMQQMMAGGCYVLPKGQRWNPVLSLPRNGPCPCGSGKKLKHCHLDTAPRVVPVRGALP